MRLVYCIFPRIPQTGNARLSKIEMFFDLKIFKNHKTMALCRLEFYSHCFNCCTALGVIELIVFMFGSAQWCIDNVDIWCEAFGGELGILYCFFQQCHWNLYSLHPMDHSLNNQCQHYRH